MTRRVVDLTYDIHEGMTTFPVHWHPTVEITQLGRHGIENRETRKVVLGTHTGTHCDAPRHFIAGGQTIDRIDPDLWIGPALLLDFSAADESHEITVADLERCIGERRPERLVLRFDWSRYWGTSKFYQDHPYLGTPAAEWLVGRGVRLLGMDTPMPDNPAHGAGSSNDSPIHKILLGQGVVLVEYLCNLSEIPSPEFELVVCPLKILDGDGAPARCLAVATE